MKPWSILVAGVLLMAAAPRLPAAETLPKDDPAWAQSVNLLKLIQPEQNTVWGKWHL